MIEPTHVLLLRHGQTAWNAEQRLQGQLDVPLDTVGQRQVAQMAAVLAGEDLAAIYSSDLKRALDTALALARVTGLPVIQDKALRERGFGRLEGLTYAEVDALWPDDALRWRRREPDFGPGGGETLRAFYARSVAAVTRLALPHPGQTIAVVAHGGVLNCMHRAATGLDLSAPRTWQLGNATVNRLLFTGEHFVVVGWDDRAHLDAPTV